MKKNVKINKNYLRDNQNDYSFLDVIFSIFVFLIMLIILTDPKRYTSCTIEGLKLFVYSVLPGLFPFMLLTKLLTEIGFVEKFFSKFDKLTNFFFGTPGISLYVLLMSFLSGYPIGAKIISDLYQKNAISAENARKMSGFCTTSGPIFVIGTVGTIMFNSYIVGLILFFSHITASIILGIILNLCFKLKRKNRTKNDKIIKFEVIKKDNIISYCISETISAIFIVGAYITIFFLIGEIFDYLNIFNLLSKIFVPILSKLKVDEKFIKPIFYGILEVTRGVKNLSQFREPISIIFASGLISLSGLSIIFQSMNFLKKAKIKAHTFIFYKCVHSIISMILCFLLTMMIKF